MASRKMIANAITMFTNLMSRKMTEEERQALEDTYYAAFKGHSDKVLTDAVYAYMDEGEYYPPRPGQIAHHIKDHQNKKHIKELVDRFTCTTCHKKVSAISAGLCLDCAGIPPVYWDYKPLPVASRSDFVMEARVKCQLCGRIALCIKEPRSSGQWQCRTCYSGLSDSEILRRFRVLGYKPETITKDMQIDEAERLAQLTKQRYELFGDDEIPF